MTEKIKDLFKDLSIRERDVLISMFGLSSSGHCIPAEEIALMYGVDSDKILKIAEQALAKLPITVEELKSIGKKAAEEFKSRMAERTPRRTLSDADSELLNIDFFETPEK